MLLDVRKGWNYGHLVGLGIAICILIIIGCLFYLTGEFWLDLLDIGDITEILGYKIGGE